MPEGARFIVNGTLRMLGTEEQPIKIKPNIYSGFIIGELFILKTNR